MAFGTILAVWADLTPGALFFALQYAGAIALLTLLILWLRPRWRLVSIVSSTSLPIPLILGAIGVFIYFGASTDTSYWTDFDKAEGYPAAAWFGIILAVPALCVGVSSAATVVVIARQFKRTG